MNDSQKIVQENEVGKKSFDGFNKFCDDNKLEKTQEVYCGLYEAHGYNRVYED